MRTSLFLLVTSLIPVLATAVGVDVNINGGGPYYEEGYDDDGYDTWVGPGLYWGIYINSEDDYWYYHNYYHGHDHDGHHGGGHEGGHGGSHGSGHGGGHGGGGHH